MYTGHFPPLDHQAGVESPPVTITDAEGRRIRIREYGTESSPSEDFEALVAMYREYDPSDRSLGLPPTTEARIRTWLDVITEDLCLVACHDDRVVGQAVLVEDGPGSAELAIFLHHDYQGARIGTELLTATLMAGRDQGIEHVWLLVEGDNRPAVTLYNDLGFGIVDTAGPDVTMAVSM